MRSEAKIVGNWGSEKEYVGAQAKDSSWSHQTEWGKHAAENFTRFGMEVREKGGMFHDDTVADFGGNDGYAANQFYLSLGIKPVVIDCEPFRLAYARKAYKLRTIECFIDKHIPLADDSIDYAFCSHTMEHMRDLDTAFGEMARVIKYTCAFVLPLEKEDHARMNSAHAVSCQTLAAWRRVIKPHWKILTASVPTSEVGTKPETYVLAVPRVKP